MTMSYPPHPPPSCLLADIQSRLEHDPGLWHARDLVSGLLWRNRALRQFLNLDYSIEPWESAIRYVHAEDTVRVEDSHSLTLKTGAVSRILVRAKPRANAIAHFNVAHQAVACSGCNRRCASIICRVWPVAALASDDPPAFRDHFGGD